MKLTQKEFGLVTYLYRCQFAGNVPLKFGHLLCQSSIFYKEKRKACLTIVYVDGRFTYSIMDLCLRKFTCVCTYVHYILRNSWKFSGNVQIWPSLAFSSLSTTNQITQFKSELNQSNVLNRQTKPKIKCLHHMLYSKKLQIF